MSGSVTDTLFLPIEKGLLKTEGTCLFLYAQHHPTLENFRDISFYTPYKFDADTLPIPVIDGKTGAFDNVLLLVPKQKEEALYSIATAYLRLKKGGVLCLAAANDAGGSRLEGYLSSIDMVFQSLSKHKARVVWAKKTGNENEQVLKLWEQAGREQAIMNDGIFSQPGLFSWDREDEGSRLLLNHLPSLAGAGADFGCGWGFLSLSVLKKNSDIKKLTAIDADARAVFCTKKNISDQRADVLWHDLRKKSPLQNLDFIVMNPPFHTGKMKDTDLGIAFISRAHESLKKTGTLYLVANRQLPYEQNLEKLFSCVEKLAEKQGFKIIKATK